MKMSDIVIVYWSGTGNTEMMAEAIKEGIGQDGGDVLLKPVEQGLEKCREYGRRILKEIQKS